MKIGELTLTQPYIMAPMAGITDLPFRKLCRAQGAGLAVSEMVNAQENLWDTDKSKNRVVTEGESLPISIQILGVEPEDMANAARYNVGLGANIIDINMGCPAKKVCKKAAGSALMRDETLVTEILTAVVNAVDVPVTLKIRTGWDRENKNALNIARIAERVGIQALTIHGRTRQDGFSGDAEYETIAHIKSQISIPVIANGDITSVEKARDVLKATGADALMIGRGAFGNPWIFRSLVEDQEYRPSHDEIFEVINTHLNGLYELYGDEKGVRVARKHLLWYSSWFDNAKDWRTTLMSARSRDEQHHILTSLINNQPIASVI
ncbi:tRNA dihydrouridine synthase DusB [Wohlfahrtiimonas chitiniclastica]|uniref:tRNA dihydrouridine synthase DusB n=1 Tax=Wohlfahrtiimonas chitiniclastica TaxID=400946 RepID=UPI000B986FA5|nr:tRNA dihydrouridine synthase DusB [Wohlfahrtiimonas chitiniclastica]MBS7836422.1 tRNA dihydrouridine synthase DusB [Wohlfahrtiimonas chitiniclastica]OYQ71725.1 tRNA dihydrouridine synthase DusB [Wohlfahrtiimonas chitiniclastica]OYQ86976.1 tRNA dihydrouridine synthase DusB [Wohlfahrtiimonas chitiniclastica]